MTNFGKGLDRLKIELVARIDAEAEATRASIITLGAGQALVYEQKLREAQDVLAHTHWDETTGANVTTVSVYEVPNVAVEAADLEISLYDAAVVIVQNATQWAQFSSPIEQARLSAKRAVRGATTAAEARAAATVNWQGIFG